LLHQPVAFAFCLPQTLDSSLAPLSALGEKEKRKKGKKKRKKERRRKNRSDNMDGSTLYIHTHYTVLVQYLLAAGGSPPPLHPLHPALPTSSLCPTDYGVLVLGLYTHTPIVSADLPSSVARSTGTG
jgi:hypothetical protein